MGLFLCLTRPACAGRRKAERPGRVLGKDATLSGRRSRPAALRPVSQRSGAGVCALGIH